MDSLLKLIYDAHNLNMRVTIDAGKHTTTIMLEAHVNGNHIQTRESFKAADLKELELRFMMEKLTRKMETEILDMTHKWKPHTM